MLRIAGCARLQFWVQGYGTLTDLALGLMGLNLKPQTSFKDPQNRH